VHDLAGKYKKTYYIGESSMKTTAKNSILLTNGHSKYYFYLDLVKVIQHLCKKVWRFSLVTGSRVCKQLEEDQISEGRMNNNDDFRNICSIWNYM